MDSRIPELPVHVIDPTQMSLIDEYIVGCFLTASYYRDRFYIDRDTVYRMPKLDPNILPASMLQSITELPRHFKFKYKLVSRVSANNPREYRYDVYSGKMLKSKSNSGDGCIFGDIEEIIGTLAPCGDGRIVYKGNKRRVGKFQEAYYDHEIERVGVEVDLTRRIPALHAKSLTLFSNSQDMNTVFVMRYLPGGDLLKLYKKDRKEKVRASHVIDTNKRIELSLAVLRALKMQVHANNIVHRDIKLANIIADLSAKYIDAYIIDYGLSCNAVIDDGKRKIGTPLYAPSEFYAKTRQTKKGDIYSMGWVLAMIWRADDNSSTTWPEAVQLAQACQFQNMFNGIDDLNDEHKKVIELVILSMVKCKPEERCAIDFVIDIFEKVLLQRKYAVLRNDNTKELMSEFVCANKIGLRLRDQLDEFSSGQCANFIHNLRRLQRLVTKSLNGLANHPLAVTEFVSRLQVVMLRGCQSKEEILDKVQTVVEIYQDCYIRLDRMRAMLGLLQAYQDKVHHPAIDLAMQRINDLDGRLRLLLDKGVGEMKLDVLVSLNCKFIKRLPAFEKEYHELLELDAVKICLKHAYAEGSESRMLVWGKAKEKVSFYNVIQNYKPISDVSDQVSQRNGLFPGKSFQV